MAELPRCTTAHSALVVGLNMPEPDPLRRSSQKGTQKSRFHRRRNIPEADEQTKTYAMGINLAQRNNEKKTVFKEKK